MALDENQLGDLGVAIHAGFPNAALGSHARSLDLTKLLIKHPSTTFLMELDHNSWSKFGLYAGDIVVVDRSIDPNQQDVVIWCQEDDFVMTKLRDVPSETPVWGTVSSVIHQFKRYSK